MADYIYLLQNRLTPAQRTALEAVRDAARAHSMPVFLVGGAVRDLTSGAPVRDLDFALQGEVGPLAADLQAAGALAAGENPVLGASFFLFRGGVRVEVGPTLTVTYPKPGQAETQPAAILDDLRRRDFTANAMAISLNEGSYGLLLDPLNGAADIENRELRLASNYGFIEQPSLLLRAARLSERLGWNLEERTQGRYETAKEEGYISALPAWDRGYELEEIFHEEDPLAALEHLRAEGWGEVLFPALDLATADTQGMDRVRDLAGQLEQIGIHTDASPVLFPLITAQLGESDLHDLKTLFPRQGYREQVDTLEARGKELSAQLTGKAAGTPSETWKMLFAAEPEVVLWTAANSRTGAVQAKLKSFLNDWPQMRQRIPYALMQEMRITPELPGYDQLLEDLFFALMDGKLATPEAAREFLEPFSPPAPVLQAAPRRKAAKGTRGRSRKAQAAVESDEDATPSVERDESDSADAEADEELADQETVVSDEPARAAEPTPAPQQTPAAKAAPRPTKKIAKPAASPAEPKEQAAEPVLAKAAAKASAVKKQEDSAVVKSEGKSKQSPAKAVVAKAVAAPPAKRPEVSTKKIVASVPAKKKSVAATPAAAKDAAAKLAAKKSQVAVKKTAAKAFPSKAPSKIASHPSTKKTSAKPAAKQAPRGASGKAPKAVKKASVKQSPPSRPAAKKSAPAKKVAAKARRR